ncbi:MAG: M15 family metallopeptidase [Candidatus Bathyarchaeia archaeon]
MTAALKCSRAAASSIICGGAHIRGVSDTIPIFNKGKHLTYTLRSLHTIFCAVDLYFVDYNKKIVNDVALYQELYNFLLSNAKIGLVWGGYFKNRDYGHFELAITDNLKEQLFTMAYSNPEYVEKHIKEYLNKQKAKKNINISNKKSL